MEELMSFINKVELEILTLRNKMKYCSYSDSVALYEKKMNLSHDWSKAMANKQSRLSKLFARSEGSLDVKRVEDGNFQYQDTNEEVGHSSNIPLYSNVDTKLSLDDFFARPTVIDNFTIQPGFVGVVNNLPVFNLWVAKNSILSKLRNYAYFRGNFKMRIILNSTKFQFGSLLVSNQPYLRQNLSLNKRLAADPVSNSDLLKSYLSMSPETMHINYGEDYVGALDLPFICPRNALRLYNSETNVVISGQFPPTDFLELGAVVFHAFNPLQSFNGSTEPINVQVQMSAHDVQLGPPTSTFLNAVSQSGAVYTATERDKAAMKGKSKSADTEDCDEYEDPGPVTKVATAVNNVAKKLTSVPFIGDYAKATEMISSKVAKVASIFGFSKPINIDPVVSFRPQMSENMAFMSGKDPVVKLTCDPKQELSLTNFGMEDKVDMMAFASIYSRPTFINSFVWSSFNTPLTDVLSSYVISPLIQTGPDQMSNLSLCARAFQYWRGDITYHIKVVGSQFHRGKLLIAFEPNIFAAPQVNDQIAEVAINTNHIYVLDLAKEREVKIKVGYMNTKNYSNMGSNAVRNYPLYFSGPPDIEAQEGVLNAEKIFTNGYIFIVPYTKLFGGDSVESQTVFVNTYVYSDQMEFAYPLDGGRAQTIGFENITLENNVETSAEPDNFGPVKSESGDDYRSKLYTQGGTQVQCSEVVINKSPGQFNQGVNLFNFGESISSFRTYLKRYVPMFDIAFANFNNSQILEMKLPLYPPQNSIQLPSVSFPPLGNVTGGDGEDRNAMSDNYYNILRHAFLFQKGGFRYKFQNAFDSTNMKFEVINSPSENDFFGQLDNYDVRLARKLRVDFVDSTGYVGGLGPRGSGGHEFVETQNPFAEYEVPFHSSDFFLPSNGVGFLLNTFTSSSLFDFLVNGHTVRVYPSDAINTDASAPLVFNFYGAIAEDFTFLRYQGAPALLQAPPPSDVQVRFMYTEGIF